MLDLAGLLDVIGAAVWQLDPIGEKVVSDPEDGLIDTFATSFDRGVLGILLGLLKPAHGNPVVALSAENFTSESD